MITNDFFENDETKDGKDGKKKEKKEKKEIIVNLHYQEYFDKNIVLKKYKLPELKSIVRQYKLPITGNKNILIERIENYFQRMKSAKRIQKIFRGWIVRYSFQLRGPAFTDRSICVNDTDFITLEPLNEIPYELFFSYKDNNNFSYGFNVSSLIQLMKKKHNGKITNPYNRESIDVSILFNIVSLNNIIQIIFHEFRDDTSRVFIQIERPSPSIIERTQHIHPSIARCLSSNYFYPRITNPVSSIQLHRSKYNRIIEIRTKPLDTRIRELFMEIDLLGNYTQSMWFSSLERRQYIGLYRSLLDIWNYHGLSMNLKMNICMFFDPFLNIFNRSIHQTDISFEEIQFICLTIMENMIYTGVDDEHRKIGALHVLTALTLVSSHARAALPWLYESIA